jgi:hypothetical protein
VRKSCLLAPLLALVLLLQFSVVGLCLRVVMDHAFKDYVAGLAAGVATVVIGHPFDTVKVGNKTVCVCFVFFSCYVVLSQALEMHFFFLAPNFSFLPLPSLLLL